MTKLEDFANKAKGLEGSFVVECENDYVLFCMQFKAKTKTARLVYAFLTRKGDELLDVDRKPELKALVHNDMVYLIKKNDFDLVSYKAELPEGVCYITDVVEEQNQLVGEPVIKELYTNLTAEPDDQENRKLEARQLKLMDSERVHDIENGNIHLFTKEEIQPFSNEDIVNWLSGYVDLKELATRRFYGRKETWEYKKSRDLTVKKSLSDPNLTEPNEDEIAEGLRSVNEKSTVTVTFEKGEKRAAAKIKVNKLWNVLIRKEHFSSYSFPTRTVWNQLSKDLNCNDDFYDQTSNIDCSNIVKITFARKVLYEKKRLIRFMYKA